MKRKKLKRAAITLPNIAGRVVDLTENIIRTPHAILHVELIDDEDTAGLKVTRARNLRDDPLAEMYSRGNITEIKFHAGRTWQYWHERSEIGPVRAIDPSKEAVDGGRFHEPDTQKQGQARKELNRANQYLGVQTALVVRMVLGERRCLRDIANAASMTYNEYKRLNARFQNGLDDLAKLWGFADDGRIVANSY